MASFALVVPATEGEALAAMRAADPTTVGVLGGGTDLLLALDAGRAAPRTLVSLRRLPWRTYSWDGAALRIGSTTSIRSLELDATIAERFPALADGIRAFGSPSLRRLATVGGNLGRAAPASDLLPVFLALDAEVELVAESGSRTVPVDAFLRASRQTDLRPGELIRAVRLAEPRRSAYRWQRVRPANDISQVAVAVAHAAKDGRWRIALGGIPPRSVLVPEAERALGPSSVPAGESIDRAAEILGSHPALGSDRRATEEYRRALVGVLFRRAVASASSLPAGGR